MSDLYDIVPYPGVAYPFACPDRMGVFGHLHGLGTRPPDEATILEVGVGDGGNLLAIAQRFPRATCIGLDASEGAIALARSRAAELGLGNVTLMVAPLETLADDGPLPICDYIIAHGVASWVSPKVRAALMRLVGRVLAPTGLAMISFLTSPGDHDLGGLVELMRHHVATVPAPAKKVAQARDIAEWQLERIRGLHGEGRAALLATLVDEIRGLPDAVLFHDLLSPERHALTITAFDGACREVGLQWLTNARMDEPRTVHLPDNLRELVRSATDPVRRQQTLDCFLMTRFRTSLVCRADAEVTRAVDPMAFAEFFAASRVGARALATWPDGVVETSVGRVGISQAAQALLRTLAATCPRALSLGELSAGHDGAGDLHPLAPVGPLDPGDVLGAAAELWLADAIELSRTPPAVANALSEHPRTGALQRLGLREGRTSASSLWHREHELDEVERATLMACDGSTPRAALSEEALEVLLMKGFLVESPTG